MARESEDDFNVYQEAAGWLTLEDAKAVLVVSKKLMTLEAPICCRPDAAPPVLGGVPPFGPLRLTRLALTDSVSSALKVFLDIDLARDLALLHMPTAVSNCITPLAVALRDNRSLTWLQCSARALEDPAAALATILGALTGHPTLRVLRMAVNEYTLREDSSALRALCALVEANTAALQDLRFWGSSLGDAELAPLLSSALAHNTHLRVLDCGKRSALSEALATDVLTAVRAATALRELGVNEDINGAPSLRTAHAMLRGRRAADAMRAR